MAEIRLQKSNLLWSSFPIDNLTPIKCVLYGRWSVISVSVLCNLSDKLYEKRKNAALKVEGIVNQLSQLEIMIKLLWRLNFWSMNLLIHFRQSIRKIGNSYNGFSSEASQRLEIKWTSKRKRVRMTLYDHRSSSILSNSMNEIARFVISVYAIICHGDKKVRNEINRKHIPKQ